MINNSNQELLFRSAEIWNEVLKKQDRRYRLLTKDLTQRDVNLGKNDLSEIRKDLFSRRYCDHIDFSKSDVILDTDDFVLLTMDFAEEARIDLKRFALNLTGQKDASEYIVGIALRTVFEVEGYYKEIPFALTRYRVPKEILIILGATLIGISTAKVAQMDAILAGSVSGVGSLLIDILADRYTSESEPEVDWLEEFVLQTLERYGIQSFEELKRVTNINDELLKKVLNDLKKKNLIKEHKSWIDKMDLKYDLSGRH